MKKIDWQTVNWSRSTKEIAHEIGVTKWTVSRARRKHAPDTLNKYFSKGNRVGRPRKPWETVDWSQSNREIAEFLDTSPSYVVTMRKKLAPETARRNRWADTDWSQRTCVIAREYGVHQNHVSAMRKKYAPHTLRKPNSKQRL